MFCRPNKVGYPLKVLVDRGVFFSFLLFPRSGGRKGGVVVLASCVGLSVGAVRCSSKFESFERVVGCLVDDGKRFRNCSGFLSYL